MIKKLLLIISIFFCLSQPKNIFAAEAPLRRLDIIETADGSLLQVDCHPASTNGLKGNIFTYTKYPNEKYQFFSYFISDNGICYGQQSFTCTADGSYVQFGMSKTNPKYTKHGVSNQLINNTFEVIKKQYGAYPKEVTGTFIDVNRDIMLKSLDLTPKNNPNRLFKSVEDTAASKAIFKGNNINRWYYLSSYRDGTATYRLAEPGTHTPIKWVNNKAVPLNGNCPPKSGLGTSLCIGAVTIGLEVAYQHGYLLNQGYSEKEVIAKIAKSFVLDPERDRITLLDTQNSRRAQAYLTRRQYFDNMIDGSTGLERLWWMYARSTGLNIDEAQDCADQFQWKYQSAKNNCQKIIKNCYSW